MSSRTENFAEDMTDALSHAKTRLHEAHVRQAGRLISIVEMSLIKLVTRYACLPVNIKLPSTMSKKLAAEVHWSFEGHQGD